MLLIFWSKFVLPSSVLGLLRWCSGKGFACQCRRCRFDPWVGKIPWRRKWQPTPGFFAWKIPWTEEPSGLQSMEQQKVRHYWAHTHTHTHTLTHSHTPISTLSFQHASPCSFISRAGLLMRNLLFCSFLIGNVWTLYF